jgi:antitoxin component of RelBE/YafQ-DinJ toxin-antitoxin module
MAQNQTESVTIQIDRQLRASGEALFTSFGLSFSTAMNALLKEAVEKKKNPLDAELGDASTYSAELAKQWAADDPEFCAETYKDNPYFTKKMQAEIRQADAEINAGKYVEQILVNGEWVVRSADA